jgi:hypothetical protein
MPAGDIAAVRPAMKKVQNSSISQAQFSKFQHQIVAAVHTNQKKQETRQRGN